MDRRTFVKMMGILSTLTINSSCLFFKRDQKELEKFLSHIGKEWVKHKKLNSGNFTFSVFNGDNQLHSDWIHILKDKIENDKLKNEIVFFKEWTFFKTELDLCAFVYLQQ